MILEYELINSIDLLINVQNISSTTNIPRAILYRNFIVFILVPLKVNLLSPDRIISFYTSCIFAESSCVILSTDWRVIKPLGNIQKNYILLLIEFFHVCTSRVCRLIYIITFPRNNLVDCSENNYETGTYVVLGSK